MPMNPSLAQIQVVTGMWIEVSTGSAFSINLDGLPVPAPVRAVMEDVRGTMGMMAAQFGVVIRVLEWIWLIIIHPC